MSLPLGWPSLVPWSVAVSVLLISLTTPGRGRGKVCFRAVSEGLCGGSGRARVYQRSHSHQQALGDPQELCTLELYQAFEPLLSRI